MSGGWSLPAGLLVASALVAAVLAGYVAWRRTGPAGTSLAVVLAALSEWSAAGAFELVSADLQTKLLWGDLKYAGIAAVPLGWVPFVLHYTGRGRYVRRRLLAALCVVPVLIMGLLFNDRTHDLVRYYGPEAAQQRIPYVEAGPLFWVFHAYLDTILIASTALLGVSLARASRVYWRQSALLAAALVLPWAVNLLYNFGVEPFAPVDFSPVAFVLSVSAFVWGVFRQRLLDLAPVARSAVVERMTDGVLVLDAYGRIVDSNPAVRRVIGRSQADILGHPLQHVLPDATHLLPQPGRTSPGDVTTEIVVADGDGRRFFDATVTALPGPPGHSPGQLVVLRDVTERREHEAELRRALAERTRIARALEQSLVPGTLPAVPHLDLAARYRPAGDGTEIGGDFYDVYPTGDGTWAVALGDVSGKGAEAAALTALVRYTLRALSMQHERPATVLRLVNDAVLRQSGEERYSTLALSRVRPAHDCAALCLALGGHLPPLVARADGRVEAVGVPGTLLGLLDDCDVTETDVVLGPGDTLCLFTDGVTEARHGGEMYGEERLAAVLARSIGQPAEDVAAQVLRSVVSFQNGYPGDDIAVLVLRVRRS